MKLEATAVETHEYPLVMTNIAIENGIFLGGENQLFLWPCSIAMLNYQRVSYLITAVAGKTSQ